MTWWLRVFFLVQESWGPGDQMSPAGWSPREYETSAECPARKAFAKRQCRDDALPSPTVWICRHGEPARSVGEVLELLAC
jgi:hypothetical protein